jgi:CheY-like chemotaxis protein
VFSVRDTGIGIPPEKLDTIFESFRQGEDGLTRSYPGLGLGLALVQKLTDAMGGRVTVASQQGIGSVFTVEIPAASPPVAVAAESAPDPVPTILAVEDNPVGLKVLRHVLERRRVRVVPAASGREAIEAARRQPVDLILMDLGMPDIDGLTAADEIRKLPGYESVPILALTANYSEQVKRECLGRGMKAFLSKPIDPRELWGAVSHYLSRFAL